MCLKGRVRPLQSGLGTGTGSSHGGGGGGESLLVQHRETLSANRKAVSPLPSLLIGVSVQIQVPLMVSATVLCLSGYILALACHSSFCLFQMCYQ